MLSFDIFSLLELDFQIPTSDVDQCSVGLVHPNETVSVRGSLPFVSDGFDFLIIAGTLVADVNG